MWCRTSWRLLRSRRAGEHRACRARPTAPAHWGDAATMIPWNHLQKLYGDKARSCAEQYEGHEGAGWTVSGKTGSASTAEPAACGPRASTSPTGWRWTTPAQGSCFGGTDPLLRRLLRTTTTPSAPTAQGRRRPWAMRRTMPSTPRLADEIKAAFRREYFHRHRPHRRADPDRHGAGAVASGWCPTRPASALVQKALRKKLADRQDPSGHRLRGQPITSAPRCPRTVCPTWPTPCLLNEDFPSWLYEVNMGATTVWERWNSVLPDGPVERTRA